MLIAPSILSADFGNLASDVKAVSDAGCDYIHIDVMDGHFVPNITIGPMVVEALKKATDKPLDIHFMVQNNTFFIELFAHLQPKYVSFHIEEEKHAHRLIQKIKSCGIKPAITLNPHTTPEAIEFLLEELDMVLVMSVNPGFGGQSFIKHTPKKVEKLKKMIELINPNCLIEVDGGVNDKNVVDLKNAGCDIVVAGNYIFKSDDYKKAIDSLRV